MGAKASAIVKQGTGMSVFGLYRDFRALRAGANALKGLGFGNHDVSVLFPERALPLGTSDDHFQPAFFRAGIGFMGPLIGGTLALLTYIRPEGRGIVAGALVSMGIPSYEAEQYEGGIRAGKLLICARSFSCGFANRAMEALLRTGAQNIVATLNSAASQTCRPGRDFNSMSLEPLFESSFVS